MLSQFVVPLVIPAVAILSRSLKIKVKAERQSAYFLSIFSLFPDAYWRAFGAHPKSGVSNVGVPLEVEEMQIDD